ncbi:hypothetical protein [Streptomyces sp. NPDC054834]
MTHTPIKHPVTDPLTGAEARLLAGLASATSLAGVAAAAWTAVRAFARHNQDRAANTPATKAS